MAVNIGTDRPAEAVAVAWYAHSPNEVATAFGVDPAAGLSAGRASELLAGTVRMPCRKRSRCLAGGGS